jgi:purine-nucleoside phosphorylase
MEDDNAVIKPQKPRTWPSCPHRTAVMVSSPADLKNIVAKAGLSDVKPHVFMNSRMYCDPGAPAKTCIAGPFIGSPYAVMLLETLVAWGIDRVILFGWCGSLCAEVGMGDIVIPESAFPGDGTSPHYCLQPGDAEKTSPSGQLNSLIIDQCREMDISCRVVPVWTTDGVFRETPDLINRYREKGAMAVEMETAALFAVGAYRCIDIAAVLAVSDEVHTLSWQTGFGSNRFKKSRKDAIELILAITRRLDLECSHE